MTTTSYDPHGDVLLIELAPGADGPGTVGEETAPAPHRCRDTPSQQDRDTGGARNVCTFVQVKAK